MKKRNALQIAEIKRRRRVMDFLEEGVTDVAQMAAALNVSVMTLCGDVKHIKKELLAQEMEEGKEVGALAIKRFEWSMRQAAKAWKISQQPAEEVSTTYTPRKCPDCKDGMTGPDEDQWCGTCDGKGTILVETTTRKVKGQAGDPAFLGAYQAANKEIAKLRNLYETSKAAKGVEVHKHDHLHIDMSKVPADVIIEARTAYAKLMKLAGPVGEVERG